VFLGGIANGLIERHDAVEALSDFPQMTIGKCEQQVPFGIFREPRHGEFGRLIEIELSIVEERDRAALRGFQLRNGGERIEVSAPFGRDLVAEIAPPRQPRPGDYWSAPKPKTRQR
jgi:hypothetical protein